MNTYLFRVGDKVYVKQTDRLDHRNKIVWKWSDNVARVMAIGGGYAMCRFKGCVPFVRRLDELKLVESPEEGQP